MQSLSSSVPCASNSRRSAGSPRCPADPRCPQPAPCRAPLRGRTGRPQPQASRPPSAQTGATQRRWRSGCLLAVGLLGLQLRHQLLPCAGDGLARAAQRCRGEPHLRIGLRLRQALPPLILLGEPCAARAASASRPPWRLCLGFGRPARCPRSRCWLWRRRAGAEEAACGGGALDVGDTSRGAGMP